MIDRDVRDLLAEAERLYSDLEGGTALSFPPLHGETSENIGAFIVAWGILERELDGAFHVLFHTDATLAVCLYANLGTKAKIDILASATTMLSELFGVRLTKTAHNVLHRISDLTDKARTTIAHGQLKYFIDVETGRYTWELVRHIARKHPAIVIHPGTPRYWRTQELITLRLAQKWRSCVAKMHPKLDGKSLADLEEVCLAQIRASEPSYASPRKHRPRRKSALEGRQTKLAKWPRT